MSVVIKFYWKTLVLTMFNSETVFISQEDIMSNPRYCQIVLNFVYKKKLVTVVVGEAHLVKEWLVIRD